MFIRDSVWSGIREQFSEEEKMELREAVTSEAICPRGFEVDGTKLGVALALNISVAIQ